MFHSYTKIIASRLMFSVITAVVVVFPAVSVLAEPLALVGGTIFTAPQDAPIEEGVIA